MPPSPAVAARVEAEAQKLQRYFERIKHCHVVIIAPHRHHRQGRCYSMHVEIAVPRSVLVISHEPASHLQHSSLKRVGKRTELEAPHKDIFVVIREAFDAARRRLEDYVRVRRGDVKRHEPRVGMESLVL